MNYRDVVCRKDKTATRGKVDAATQIADKIISAIGEDKELADKAFKIAQESINQK
jgi:hypothetical protein